MDSEAMAVKATGPVKAAPSDPNQLKKVNQKSSQPPTSLTSTTNPSPSQPASEPVSQSPLAIQTTPTASSKQDSAMADKVIIADEMTSTLMVLGILAVVPAMVGALAWIGVPWMAFITAGATFLVAASLRIIYMNQGYRPPVSSQRHSPSPGSETAKAAKKNLLKGLPAVYQLYVLGSGGHTSEMMAMLRVSISPSSNMHRRYVYTSGDRASYHAIEKFEGRLAEYWGNDGGTWDAVRVKRARDVHQSLRSTVWTALLCTQSLYIALTFPPAGRSTQEERELFKWPHVITTNGPGTGLIIAIIAKLLRILCIAPAHSMKILFFETWAHPETFSLTGKMFHYSRWLGGLADVLVVQHRRLGRKYGYPLFDFITPRS